MKASTRIRTLSLAAIGLLILAGASIDAQAAAARPKPAAKPVPATKPVRASSVSSLGSVRTGGRQDRRASVSGARRASGQSATQVSGTAATPSAWQAAPAARAPAAATPPPLVRQNASPSLQVLQGRQVQRTSSSGTLVRMTSSPPVQ